MGRHVSSSQEKVVWLVNHPDLIKGWPIKTGDRPIITAMRSDGLISMKANDYDIQDLGKLIGRAREILRKLNRKKL